MDILEANRGNALRVQWYECKPWRAYEIAHPTSRVIREETPAEKKSETIQTYEKKV
jgi:hypothetical protein